MTARYPLVLNGTGIQELQSGDTLAGAGDVTGPASSVDGEVVLFNGTTGKIVKSATTTGLLKATSGVLGAAVSGTDIKTVGGTSLLGSGDVPLPTSTLTIDNKTTAYTVVAADLGKIINCTSGTFTVSLTAAATLGAGFNCWVWNTSSTATDAITIDPNGSETINGAATFVLRRGNGVRIISNGSGWEFGESKKSILYAENCPNNYSVVANYPVASGSVSVAWGAASTSGSTFSTAGGTNSAGSGSVTATGNGAMALGGSYASGADALAAAIGNNTSTYGATGANSVAHGYLSKASGANSFAAIKGTASGNYSCAIGFGAVASGDGSFAYGLATAAQYGKQAFSWITSSYQTGKMLLGANTADATPKVMTGDLGTASATNQVILPNDSTYAFTILVVARRTDADNESAAYKFEGCVDRNGSAATTAIVGTVAKTVLAEDTAAWDCNVTADTTNGGLAITVTGEAGKTIRWCATAWTVELTG